MELKNTTLQFPKDEHLNLYFFKSVDEQSVGDFYKEFNSVLTEYNAAVKANSKKLENAGISYNSINYNPVNIHMSTYGGCVYDGLAMHNVINQACIKYPFDIKMISSGIIASMGIILLLSVPLKNRVAYKDTVFMIHQVSSLMLGKVKDLDEQVEEVKRINTQLFDIIKNNTSITQEQLDQCYNGKKDWFITAEEAIKLGLISSII